MDKKQFANGNTVIDCGITREAVAVYISLSRHLQKRNGIYPGDKIIAEESGVAEQDVPKYLEQLRHTGFIT